MGLFDSVYLACPVCGIEIEEQTKAMIQPYMRRFDPDRLPTKVAADIVYGEPDDSPEPYVTCDCGVRLEIKTNVPEYAEVWLEVAKDGELPG